VVGVGVLDKLMVSINNVGEDIINLKENRRSGRSWSAAEVDSEYIAM